jgi:hypothetical protein
MLRAELADSLRPLIVDVDRTPTLHYYGTVELRAAPYVADRCDNFYQVVDVDGEFIGDRYASRDGAEAYLERFLEGLGLAVYDDESADRESEAGALYRAEMRHSL